MSSCLSGGGRSYGFDLEIVKSPSTWTRTSQTSSPSSTLSESSNSPLAISTRKPRTPRKRPNQTYNEAAVLLSTAYPTIFSTKHLAANPSKFTKLHESFYDESSELLLPFRVIDHLGFPLHQPKQPNSRTESKLLSSAGQSPVESEFPSNYEIEFDAESILDEEIEAGVDSIMGNLSVNEFNTNASCYYDGGNQIQKMGMGFEFGVRSGVRALRPHVDDGDWWRFPTVDVVAISPKFKTVPVSTEKKKKKKKKVENLSPEPESSCQLPEPEPKKKPPNSGLLLKLNYDNIMSTWSDRGSPFSEECPGSEFDVSARLAQIDLFSDNGVREASVLRYKEKRRTRLFSKKIRYQVRKVNADRRPRMKGRFVRRPNSTGMICKVRDEIRN